MRRDATLLWFLHIPKTAGTTFGAILERTFPRREMIDVYPGFGLRQEELAGLPPERVARARCVRGHFDFGAHRAIDRPFTYITFLRRPEQQVRSRWNHARSSRAHPLHDFAVAEGLAGFARHSPDNFQLRSVLGLPPVDGEHAPLDASHVDRAFENFERHFTVVGIAERFDESLLLMARRLGFGRIHYVRRNVRRRPDVSGPAPADDAASTEIERSTALDRRLYDAALERLEREIAAEPEFDRALAAFRLENERYSRRMRWIDAARHAAIRAGRRGRAAWRRVRGVR